MFSRIEDHWSEEPVLEGNTEVCPLEESSFCAFNTWPFDPFLLRINLNFWTV
jgi:hypothetical protein